MNVEAVNDQYLANTSVLNEVLELLHIAIFEPNLENGVFKESIVEREKKTVIQRIESILTINLVLRSNAFNKFYVQMNQPLFLLMELSRTFKNYPYIIV